MTQAPSTMLDAFKCLLEAMSPKEKENADWYNRMTHLLYSYGFTKETYLRRFPDDEDQLIINDWILDTLVSGANRPKPNNMRRKGITDRGLDGDFSPIKSIIKIENSMISGSECRMCASTNPEKKKDSNFYPWMGGRWTKLAIIILSILRGNSAVKTKLESQEEWLAIPEKLAPSDYIRVLPVKFLKIEAPQNDHIVVQIWPDSNVTENWDHSMLSISLEVDPKSDTAPDIFTLMMNDRDSPKWISISKPLPKWADKQGNYHIPKFHWNLINNQDNHYHLARREEG